MIPPPFDLKVKTKPSTAAKKRLEATHGICFKKKSSHVRVRGKRESTRGPLGRVPFSSKPVYFTQEMFQAAPACHPP